MRVSSDTTTSTIIQLLHESNSFFGLVGEAEYYQPLVERVKVISDSTLEKKTDVILTGHSLGGGLSRIVAALTHLPSVSFAPPGIALSHRKFSILEEKKSDDSRHRHSNQNRKISGMVDLHDQSMAVITDFDMLVLTFSNLSFISDSLNLHPLPPFLSLLMTGSLMLMSKLG
jgi:hypothetical protein